MNFQEATKKLTADMKTAKAQVPINNLYEIGFELSGVESGQNSSGDDFSISVLAMGEHKAAYIEVEHETESEGTLHFQTLYLLPETELFLEEYYKGEYPIGTRIKE